MTDDTVKTAVDEDGNPIVPTFSTAQEEYMDKMFEKQSEKLTSHFGRIITKQMEEKFLPQIKKEQINPDDLNEQLSNKLFGGDVNGTVRDIIKNYNKEETQLVTEKQSLVDKEMEKFADQPLFKETESEIRKIALEAVEKGHPPAPAVELGVAMAGKNFLQNKSPEYNLGMVGQGKIPVRTKTAKIPAELKAAADRDIADGIFKDEAEYMAQLSPDVKERYGI